MFLACNSRFGGIYLNTVIAFFALYFCCIAYLCTAVGAYEHEFCRVIAFIICPYTLGCFGVVMIGCLCEDLALIQFCSVHESKELDLALCNGDGIFGIGYGHNCFISVNLYTQHIGCYSLAEAYLIV